MNGLLHDKCTVCLEFPLDKAAELEIIVQNSINRRITRDII